MVSENIWNMWDYASSNGWFRSSHNLGFLACTGALTCSGTELSSITKTGCWKWILGSTVDASLFEVPPCTIFQTLYAFSVSFLLLRLWFNIWSNSANGKAQCYEGLTWRHCPGHKTFDIQMLSCWVMCWWENIYTKKMAVNIKKPLSIIMFYLIHFYLSGGSSRVFSHQHTSNNTDW